MFQKSASALLAPAIRNVVQRRSVISAISSPPTQKVPAAEKLVLGGCVAVSGLVIPAWVLYHIKDYRGSA